MIKVENLSVKIKEKNILENINLELYSKNLYVIKGKNGVGKTTFIKAILNQIKYDGKINCGFKNDKSLKYISYFSQEAPILENYTVKENLELLSSYNKSKELLKSFSLDKLLYKKVINLSGGQKQKLKIIITLLSDKDIIIMDEPLNHLDKEAKKFLETYLKEKSLNDNKLIIIINHEDYYFKDEIKILFKDKTVEKIGVEKENKNKTFKKINFKLKWMFFNRYKFLLSSIFLVLLLATTLFIMFFLNSFTSLLKVYNDTVNGISNDIIYLEKDYDTCLDCEAFSTKDLKDMSNIKGVQEVNTYSSLFHNFENNITPNNGLISYSIDRDKLNPNLIKSPSYNDKLFIGEPKIKVKSNRLMLDKETLEDLSYELNSYNIKSLLYGEFPNDSNEVLVDEYAALEILKVKGLSNVEDLIGMKIEVPEISCYENDCSTIKEEKYINSYNLNKKDYKISGIYESVEPYNSYILFGYDKNLKEYKPSYEEFLSTYKNTNIKEDEFEKISKGYNQVYLKVDPNYERDIFLELSNLYKDVIGVSKSIYLKSDMIKQIKKEFIKNIIIVIVIGFVISFIFAILFKSYLWELKDNLNTFIENGINKSSIVYKVLIIVIIFIAVIFLSIFIILKKYISLQVLLILLINLLIFIFILVFSTYLFNKFFKPKN